MDNNNHDNNSKYQTELKDSMNDSGYKDISFDNPLFLSRESEQQSLESLNNRLAVYIEHVRNQENKSNTNKTLEEMSEIPSIQLENLKSLYEQEINDLREVLDSQSISLASLTIANNKLCAENKNFQNTVDNQSERIQKLNETNNILALENASLSYQLDTLKNNQNSFHILTGQLKTCQEQLEKEVLLRTSSDNACLTYKEKLEFNEAVFKKELGALMITHKSTLKTMSELQSNFAMKLTEEMKEERKKLKKYLNEMQDLIKRNFLNTIDDAVNSIAARNRQLSQLRSANDLTLEDKHRFQMEIDKIKASHIKLENQLSNIQTLNEEEIGRLNYLVKEITDEKIDGLETSFEQFQNLQDSICENATIGDELAIYRTMLDTEETRTDFHSPPESKRPKTFPEFDENMDKRKILKAVRRNKVCAIM